MDNRAYASIIYGPMLYLRAEIRLALASGADDRCHMMSSSMNLGECRGGSEGLGFLYTYVTSSGDIQDLYENLLCTVDTVFLFKIKFYLSIYLYPL